MKTLSIALLSLVALTLVGCGQKPMTDADMAAKYGLSLEEYQEQKEAAARMNMSIEDHLNMGHGGDHENMDHGDMKHEEMNQEPETEAMDHHDEMDSHEKAAAKMGMTLEEHEAAGHPGH